MDNVGYSVNIDTPDIAHNQDKKNREKKSKRYEKLQEDLDKLIANGKNLEQIAQIIPEKYYTISKDKTTGRVYNIKPKGSKIDRTKTDQNIYLKAPRI